MILVIDVNSKENKFGRDEFVTPVASLVGDCEIKHYKDINQDKIKKYKKIIICGTALKDNEYLENIDNFSWLNEYDGEILGICAGMQIIGLLFGCSLKKCNEIGMTKIKDIKKNRFFSTVFEAYELHNYALNVSNKFEILGKSDKCVQAIKHKSKEFYGFLFHFETRNKHFIDGFLEK